MRRPAKKIITAAFIAAMCFGFSGMNVQAESYFGTTAVAGFALTIDDFVNAVEDSKPADDTTEAKTTEAKTTEEKTSTDDTDKKTEATKEKKTKAKKAVKKSEYDDTALAKVNNYVNIRKKPNEEAKILGKMYKGAAGTIVKKGKEWTKVKSGSVTGYVKNEFLVSGTALEKYAEKVCDKEATVNTMTLKVREKKSTKATILTLIPEGETYNVLKETDGWVGIRVDEDIKGYVSKDYVDLEFKFDKAISLKEEREAEKKAAALAAAQNEQESAPAAASSSNSSSSSSSRNSSSSSSNSSSSSSSSSGKSSTSGSSSSQSSSGAATAQNIVNYALQFVGNPYVWGGTSLTNGADCSGFTQAVYRHFGISINRSSRTQVSNGTSVSLSEAKAGDLIFYKNGSSIGHVALCIGGGKVVHASSSRTGIIVSNMYYRTPYCARRIVN